MQITKENIEEIIFDYFEGNLSEYEKTELLNFIHLHPEYEKDFTQWAQSYGHIEEEVIDYGLTSKLLKKPYFVWNSNYLYPSATVIAIVIGIFSFFSSQKQHFVPVTAPPQIEFEPKAINTENEDTIHQERVNEAVKKPTDIKYRLSTTRPDTNQVDETLLKEKDTTPFPNPAYEEYMIKEEPIVDEKIAIIENNINSVGPDTVASQTKSVAKPESIKKKNKKRLPLNLHPSEKFVPINDNL